MKQSKPCLRAALSILGALLVFTATPASAQEAPFNSSMVAQFDQPGQVYADVWGDGNFAYLAHFGQRVVDIIDLTDPANPVLAATYDTNVNGASAQDVKVHDGLMFVGLESVTPGCQIVDVRDPFNPVKLTDITVRSAVHNVFYDEGWLYIVDSSQPQIDIIDLRTYDPNSPPATISAFTHRVTNVGQFVHDITVQNGRLFASAWNSYRVYDVSDLANQAPVFLGAATGASAHSAWATDDGRFLVVGEEHGTAGLTLYEVIDNGTSVDLEVRDYYFLSGLRAGSSHNMLIEGNRVYVSWYAAGVQVLEIDPDTATWSLVASFDTSPVDGVNGGVFSGNWGVYPFLGADKVLASDSSTGLWVIDVDPNVLLLSLSNRPMTILPESATPLQLNVKSIGAPAVSGTVMLNTAVNGGPAKELVMTDLGTGEFTGDLPGVACGSVVDYFVSAENLLGTAFVDPPGAPAETYRARVATQLTRVFEDTFDLDLGWTVENTNVQNGAWERGDPNGTGAQSEHDFSGDLDDSCFFTGQANPGSSISTGDVDGGPTTLVSPPIDFSGGDGIITYAFWFFNNDEQATDDLVLEVTNDGNAWIPVTRHTGTFGGWEESSFLVGDFVTPNDQVQIRFQISDNPNDSIAEAMIDFVRADVLFCGQVEIFADGFESGDVSAW